MPADLAAWRILHYKPADGWVADIIPVFYEGRAHLFYIFNVRTQGVGCGWGDVSTVDFVTYVDHGLALSPGDHNDPYFNCFTGSVVSDDQLVHLFWTADDPRGGENSLVISQ